MKASGIEHVIFRPSFVFGPEGGALGQFKKIAKLAPVTPIVGPGTQRIQPIWGDDVAAYFAAGVEKPEAANRTFEIGGPDVVTWNEFWSRLKQAQGLAPAEPARSVRPDARAGRGAREAAEAAGDARPVEDAGRGRQRRLELGRGRHLQPPARPARRATPQGDRRRPKDLIGSTPGAKRPFEMSLREADLLPQILLAPTSKGRFRGPSNVGTSLYWQRRFLPKRRVRCDAFATPSSAGPLRWLDDSPCRSQGHVPTGWHLHCPYWKSPLPDHLLSADSEKCSRRTRRSMSARAAKRG